MRKKQMQKVLEESFDYMEHLQTLLNCAGIAYPYYPLGNQDPTPFVAAVVARFQTNQGA